LTIRGVKDNLGVINQTFYQKTNLTFVVKQL